MVRGQIPWSEIEEERRNVQEEIKKALDAGEIAGDEHGILIGAFHSLNEPIQELRDLEKKSQGTSVPPLQQELIGIIDRTHLATARIQTQLPVLGRVATSLLNRIWARLRDAISWFLGVAGPKLNVDGWSIGATGGFPGGISTTISVTFKP